MNRSTSRRRRPETLAKAISSTRQPLLCTVDTTLQKSPSPEQVDQVQALRLGDDVQAHLHVQVGLAVGAARIIRVPPDGLFYYLKAQVPEGENDVQGIFVVGVGACP